MSAPLARPNPFPAVYDGTVKITFALLMCMAVLPAASLPRARRQFHWDWHNSQSLDSAPSLKDAKITGNQRTELAKAIKAQVGPPDHYDPEMMTEAQVKQVVLKAKVEMIRLSQDKKAHVEVVASVRHYCSADGNCTFWFFRRTPHGYRLLLDAIGQGFTVQKTATNGFWDLVVNMHGSATDQWLKVYRYARGRYWRVACYDADWAPLENGVVHQLKEPRITASACN